MCGLFGASYTMFEAFFLVARATDGTDPFAQVGGFLGKERFELADTG